MNTSGVKYFALHLCDQKLDNYDSQQINYYRVIRILNEYKACSNWPDGPIYLEVIDDVENPDGTILAVVCCQSYQIDNYNAHWVCFWDEKIWLTKEVTLAHRFDDSTCVFLA